MKLTNEAIKSLSNPIERKKIIRYSFRAFIIIYCKDWFKEEFADYHYELIDNLELLVHKGKINEAFYTLIVEGYRGCGKTIILTAFMMWLFLNKIRKCLVVIGNTQDGSAGKILQNIKYRIENNDLIKKDYDIPVSRTENESIKTQTWSNKQLFLHGVSITAMEKGTSNIRGFLINGNRPDAILCDDIQDVQELKNEDIRKKDKEWFAGNVLPAAGKDLILVMLGNLVHRDCIVASMVEEKPGKEKRVKTMKIPLFKGDGAETQENISWKGKFATLQAIEDKKADILEAAGETLGLVIWEREYKLNILSEADAVFQDSDFHYYDEDEIDENVTKSGFVAIGVDLAISKKQTADYTCMVSALVGRDKDGHIRIYISPNIINKRLSFHETIAKLKEIQLENSDIMDEKGRVERLGYPCYFGVENNQYQDVVVEELEYNGISVKGLRASTDKIARAKIYHPHVKNGLVLFPKNNEKVRAMILQCLAFPNDTHDDQVDALVYCIQTALSI